MGNPFSWWRSFLALPNNHPGKIIGMAFIVAGIASLFVSFTAVTLQPLREANRERASKAGMLAIIGQLGVKPPKPRFVELSSGRYVKKDSGIWRQLPPSRDPAHIGLLEDVATVYEVRDGDTLSPGDPAGPRQGIQIDVERFPGLGRRRQHRCRSEIP